MTPQLQDTTVGGYIRTVTDIKEGLGAIRLRDPTPLMIERFDAELSRTGGRKGTGLSPKSIRDDDVTVREALADAERLGVVGHNPASRAKAPTAVRPQTPTWTAEELAKCLPHASDDPLFALWVLLTTTGMRRGEAVGPRWSDVDLDPGTVPVNQPFTTVGTEVVFSPPKSDRSRRRLVLDPDRSPSPQASTPRLSPTVSATRPSPSPSTPTPTPSPASAPTQRPPWRASSSIATRRWTSDRSQRLRG